MLVKSFFFDMIFINYYCILVKNGSVYLLDVYFWVGYRWILFKDMSYVLVNMINGEIIY